MTVAHCMRSNPKADGPANVGPARRTWDQLAADLHPARGSFDLDKTGTLPTAVRRWLAASIEPGTPLSSWVKLTMHGEIRLGQWRPFRATQLLAPGLGYVWAASTSLHGMRVGGFDRYTSGTGEMNWRLLGLIPVLRARGQNVDRSAAGRLLAEIVLAPTAFDTCIWSGVDERPDCAKVQVPHLDSSADLHIDPAGDVTAVTMLRWGNPNQHAWGSYPFGVNVHDHSVFGGVRIPSSFQAGWWWGTDRWSDGEFLRAQITDAQFA